MWRGSGTTLALLLLSVFTVQSTQPVIQPQLDSKNLDKVDALLAHCQAFMTGEKRDRF